MSRLRAATVALLICGGCQGPAAMSTKCANAPAIFDAGEPVGRWLAADAQGIYWWAQDGLRATPRCGGPAKTLVSAPPGMLVASNGSLYFASNTIPGSLGTVKTDGSAMGTVVAQRTFVTGLAVDDQYVYFLDGDTLRRVPRAGGAADDLLGGLDHPTGLALSGEELYWVNQGGEFAPGDVVKATKAGALMEIVGGEAYVGGLVGALALDDTNVYFGGWSSDLLSVPRGGGVAQQLLHGENATVLATHAGVLYWINEQYQPDQNLNGLWRMPTAGGMPELLDAEAVGESLAFDGEDLFYLLPTGIARRSLL